MPTHRTHNLVRSIEDARNAWNSTNDRRASLVSRKQRRLERKIERNGPESPLAQSNILSEEEQANVMNLVSMFPEIEPGVIANVYRSANGSSITAIDKLLELTAEIENRKEEETASETESESESEEQYDFDEDSGEVDEPPPEPIEEPFENQAPQEEEQQHDEEFETCVESFEVEDYNSDEHGGIDYSYQDGPYEYFPGDQNDDEEFNEEDPYNPLEDSYNPLEEASQNESDPEDYNDDFEPESEAEPQLSYIETPSDLSRFEQFEQEQDDENEEQEEQEEQEEGEEEGEQEQEDENEGDEEGDEEIELSEEPSPRLITPIQPTPNHELEWTTPTDSNWIWPVSSSSAWAWAQEEQTQLQQLETQEELLRQERKREAKMAAKLEAAAQMAFMRLRIKELEDHVVRVEEEKRNGMRYVLHQIAEIKQDHTSMEVRLAERDRIISDQSRTISDRDEEISVLSTQVANLSTQLENREVLNLESFLQSSKDVLSDRAQVLQQTVQKNVSDGIARLDQNDMVQYIRDVVSNLKDEVTVALSKPINTAKEYYNAQVEPQVENQVEPEVEIEEGYQRSEIEAALKKSMETYNLEFRERAHRNAPVEEWALNCIINF